MAVSTAWQISRGPERLLPQVCEMCFVIHYQEQKKKKRRENVKFTIHVLSRLTALLTWAASLGWTSAVTCCNIYREYYEPVVFTLSYVHRSCSSHHFILFEYLTIACMHILPLPPCGLYSIRAQNGYGQHRSCKIVLLTLVAPRGVTDLYLSWGINIEHARAAYHETCGIEYQQPHRRCNSQPPYYKWNIAQARPACLTCHAACKVEFQPSIGRTHSWRFSIFLQKQKPGQRHRNIAKYNDRSIGKLIDGRIDSRTPWPNQC